MRYYFAPMEGVTGYPFRNAHSQIFPGMDRYYTPFVAVGPNMTMRKREIRDTDPANDETGCLIPQVLTSHAESLVWAMEIFAEKGYREVNLNLGCPSPTVVTKGKGAGMLKDPTALDMFLEDTFDGLNQKGLSGRIRLSVKTRLGVTDASEMKSLTEIYNRYPIAELSIHARTLAAKYGGEPDLDAFAVACRDAVMPVCYNGNIFSKEEMQNLEARFPASDFPKLEAVMLGRGIVANPALQRECAGGAAASRDEIRRFHAELLRRFRQEIPEDNNILFRMKELWAYLGDRFSEDEKKLKKVRKAKKMAEYEAAVSELLNG